MGSASTNLKINVGGFEGRKLKAGDILKIGKAGKIKNIEKRELLENTYDKIIKARVVLGPQDDMFCENDLALFSKQQYTVTSDIDRMGIRPVSYTHLTLPTRQNRGTKSSLRLLTLILPKK